MGRHRNNRGNHHPKANPNQNASRSDTCNVSGDIRVSGEIETKLPPDFIEKCNADGKKSEARENKRFIVEIVTVILVFIYAGLTAWQASSASGQLKEARRSTDAAVQNFQMGQRAWIGTSSAEIPDPVPEKALVWRITYKNFGNSPAMNVQIRETIQLFNSSRIDETAITFLSLNLPKAQNSLSMFNNQTYTDTGGINFVLTEDQVSQVKREAALIVYIAEVSYRDIFGIPRTTKVCELWSPLRTKKCGVGESIT